MTGIGSQIIHHAATLPEGTVLYANAYLHLGTRAAVSKALSRLAREGRLIRFWQGVYVLPVETRFGRRTPDMAVIMREFSKLSGEIIAPACGAVAHSFGLTTQVPVRYVYLTSGSAKVLRFDNLTVTLQHAPRWHLLYPDSLAGNFLRAMAWIGPEHSKTFLRNSRRLLLREDLDELAAARLLAPVWVAELITELLMPILPTEQRLGGKVEWDRT